MVLTSCSGTSETTLPTPSTAPDESRVDRAKPTFVNPTNVTNPYFPASQRQTAIELGLSAGIPTRTEISLLPDMKPVVWEAKTVQTAVAQSVTYYAGRIHDVSEDYYAQADDGSVWTFGRRVTKFDGEVSKEGSWTAGNESPPAMVMPAAVQPGIVFRSQNGGRELFEQVTVKAVGETTTGSLGPLTNVLSATVLKRDGSTVPVNYAPNYGRVYLGSGRDFSALAMCMPYDSVTGGVPDELKTISTSASQAVSAAQLSDWASVNVAYETMNTAWSALKSRGPVSLHLDAQMSTAITGILGTASAPAQVARDVNGVWQSALDVLRASLDIESRYVKQVDLERQRVALLVRQQAFDVYAQNSQGIEADKRAITEVVKRFNADDRAAVEAKLKSLDGAKDWTAIHEIADSVAS